MKGSISQSEYLGWHQYWNEEPWGAWRDNMHTAILAAEIRRPQVKRGTKVRLDHFLLVPPARRQRDANKVVLNALEFLAGPRNGGPRKTSSKA